MPVFMILVLIGAFLLWLLCAFAYIPLGKIAKRLWNDAKEAMTKEDEPENNNNEKEN